MRTSWLAVALVLVACDAADPAKPSPPPPPDASSTAQAERATLDDIPLGDPPAIGYVENHVYIAPDGTRSALPRGRGVSGVVPFAKGLLVSDTRWFEGTNGLSLVRDGHRVHDWPSEQPCSSGVPVRSARHVAWVSLHCPESVDTFPSRVYRAATDGTGEVARPVGRSPSSVVGFLGASVVYNVGFIEGAWITNFVAPPRRIPGVERVHDVDDVHGRLIGGRGDVARRVVDARGRLLWHADRFSLVSFSPGGTHLLARSRHGYRVLDADDGRLVSALALPGGINSWDVEWEDERHVLAVVFAARRTSIVRMGLEGSLERAASVRRMLDPLDPPYVLGAQS